ANADLITVGSEYNTVTITRLMVGPQFDVLHIDEGIIMERAYHNGWIWDLEGLDGIEKLKADMAPDRLKSVTASDGKIVGLPVYIGTKLLFYNRKTMNSLGMKPPETWEE